MNTLNPHDLIVVPAWMMRGRKSVAQAVLLYIMEAELAGTKWSFASVGRDAGTGTAANVCRELEQEGLLIVREGGKPGPYAIATELASPKAPEKPVKAQQAKKAVPMWAIQLDALWRQTEGFVGPKRMETTFEAVIMEYGPAVVVEAMKKYVDDRRGQEKQYRSVRNLAEHINEWIEAVPGTTQLPGVRSIADLV